MSRTVDLKVESIKALPGFDRCSQADIVELGRVCDELEATPGTTLVQEGRPGRRAFIVLEGRADVRREGVLLWEAARGSLVGDLGVLGSTPAPATVVATTPLRFLLLDPRAASVLLGREALARWTYGQIERRLRQVTVAPTRYDEPALASV